MPPRDRINGNILQNGIELNIIFTTLDNDTILNLSILGQQNEMYDVSNHNSKTTKFFEAIANNFPSKGSNNKIDINNFNINWLFPQNHSFYNVNLNEGKINLVMFNDRINIPNVFYKNYINFIYGGMDAYNEVFQEYSKTNINNPLGTAIFFNKNVKISGKIYCDKNCNKVYTGNTKNLEVINSKTSQNSSSQNSSSQNSSSKSSSSQNSSSQSSSSQSSSSQSSSSQNSSSQSSSSQNSSSKNKKCNKKCKNDTVKVLTPISTVIMIVFGIFLLLLLIYYIFKLSKGEVCTMYKPLLYFFCITLLVLSIVFIVLLSITSYKKGSTDSNEKKFKRKK